MVKAIASIQAEDHIKIPIDDYITALNVNPLVALEQTLHLPIILGADRVGTISITSESVFFLQAIHRIKTVLSFIFRIMKFKILENIYPSPSNTLKLTPPRNPIKPPIIAVTISTASIFQPIYSPNIENAVAHTIAKAICGLILVNIISSLLMSFSVLLYQNP